MMQVLANRISVPWSVRWATDRRLPRRSGTNRTSCKITSVDFSFACMSASTRPTPVPLMRLSSPRSQDDSGRCREGAAGLETASIRAHGTSGPRVHNPGVLKVWLSRCLRLRAEEFHCAYFFLAWCGFDYGGDLGRGAQRCARARSCWFLGGVVCSFSFILTLLLFDIR
jgi:hypothetical protein